MTLQQFRYIIALAQHGSFAKAAEICSITQPTLSKMVSNLEEELDVRLFDRSGRRVTPTALGLRIVRQAQKAVMEAERIAQLVAETRDTVSGTMRLSVGPSIAPYILPEFIRVYGTRYPGVALTIEEMRPDNMLDALGTDRIDAAIAIGGNARDGIFEIPLYTEPFMVYLSENCRRRHATFTPEELTHESMWVMKEAQCLRDSAFSFCKARETGHRIYEAGNIDTLVRVVDANGGFTIIPEMHLAFLDERQRANVRPLSGDFQSRRRVSLYIRHDYVREKMLNTVADTIRAIIPDRMLSPTLLRHGIRL